MSAHSPKQREEALKEVIVYKSSPSSSLAAQKFAYVNHVDLTKKALTTWLDPVDMSQIVLEQCDQRHPKTRAWMLDETSNWAQSSGKCLCLFGMAGTGKTVAAAAIANHLRKMFSVVTFFCSTSFPDRADPTAIVRSIAVQLAEAHPSFADQLYLVYQAKPNVADGKATISGLIEAVISEPLSKCPSLNKTVVVIDALDEAGANDLSTLSLLLKALNRRWPWDRLPIVVSAERLHILFSF